MLWLLDHAIEPEAGETSSSLLVARRASPVYTVSFSDYSAHSAIVFRHMRIQITGHEGHEILRINTKVYLFRAFREFFVSFVFPSFSRFSLLLSIKSWFLYHFYPPEWHQSCAIQKFMI